MSFLDGCIHTTLALLFMISTTFLTIRIAQVKNLREEIKRKDYQIKLLYRRAFPK